MSSGGGGPDYTTYTLDELREALDSIDAKAYPSRAEGLALLIRDRERRATLPSEDQPATKTDHPDPALPEPPRKVELSTRRVLGFVIVILGVLGIMSALLMMIATAVFDESDHEEFNQAFERLGFPGIEDSFKIMYRALWPRAWLAFVASCVYLGAGVMVLRRQPMATRFVFIAVALALLKYAVEITLALQAGGYMVANAMQSVVIAALHVAIAAVAYFADPARESDRAAASGEE